MANWTSFSEKFGGSGESVALALRNSYRTTFGVLTYSEFQARGYAQVGQDILDFLQTVAYSEALAGQLLSQVSLSPDDTWASYPGLFDPEDAAWVQVFINLIGENLSFKQFEEMSVQDLGAMLVGLAVDFYSPYHEAIWARTISLGFDTFAAEFEPSARLAILAFCQQLAEDSVIADFSGLAQKKKGELAFLVSGLASSHALIQHLIQELKNRFAAVTAEYPADDALRQDFQGALAGAYTPGYARGALAWIDALIESDVLAGLPALAGASTATLGAALAAEGPGHIFIQGIADWLDSKVKAAVSQPDSSEETAKATLALRFYSMDGNGKHLPLVGYLAEIWDVRATNASFHLGTTLTDPVGMVQCEYQVGDPSAELRMQITLTELGSNTTLSLPTVVHPAGSGDTRDVEVALPPVTSSSKTFAQLEALTNNAIAAELKSYLASEGYANLEDIRTGGGIAQRNVLAVQNNSGQAMLIDAHAQMELLSEDTVANHHLVSLFGMKAFTTIASMSREAFIAASTQAGSPLTQAEALQYWNSARKLSTFLHSQVLAHAGDRASGAQSRLGNEGGAQAGPTYEQTFGSQCDCPECASGVSPLAYLAALLDYGQKYVRNGQSLVDADALQVLFRHPYCELPADCASGSEEICQVRVAVEVLRQHLPGDASWAYKRPYMEQAYRLLLTQAGTSLDEIRRIAQASDDEKARLAERLGILPDQLQDLHIDISLTTLTEHSLELLFGLQDTRRHPLSAGAKVGDPNNDLYSWRFGQVAWGRNTDADGWIYLDIQQGTLRVFRDASKASQHLVATGTLSAAAPWTIQLNPVDDYGLSGRIELSGNNITNGGIEISVVPRLLAYRLQGQRRRWQAEDWVDPNGYFSSARLPYLDPELVNPGDIRGLGDGSTTPYASQPLAYRLWAVRKFWVDDSLYGQIGTQFGSGDLDGALGYLSGPIIYARLDTTTVSLTPWPLTALPSGYTATTISGLFAELRARLADTVLRGGALTVITDWLRMSTAAWSRIETLEARFQAGNTSFTEAEASDIIAILAQSAKKTFRAAWVQEENTEGITLSATLFWPALQGVRTGTLSLKPSGALFGLADNQVPHLDPDHHTPLDLVPPSYGDTVHLFRNIRAQDLKGLRAAAFAQRKQAGVSGSDYEAMWNTAYLGSLPTYGTGMPQALTHLNFPVGSTERTNALAYVQGALKLTEPEFREIMEVVLREIANATVQDSEYVGVAERMVTGYKRLVLWPNWANDEVSAQLFVPWMFYRAALNDWAGGTDARNAWEAALTHNTRVPMCDPDLVGPGDFFDPEYRFNAALDNPAFALWWTRNNALNGPGGWLDTIAAATIANNLTNELGTTTTELADLHTLFEDGVDVGTRLRQLGLSTATLAQLVHITALSSPTASEREVFDAIVLDVKRRRHYATWNNEERAAGIVLGPDQFVQPYRHAADQQAYVNALLQPWRGRMAERRAWEDRLQARIDQDAALLEGHRAQVQSVEGDALRTLRDILLMKDAAPGETLAERADSLSARLLTDMRTACCQRTTRVAAAIETLQQLFHGLRTAQLDASLSSLSLANDPDDFDADWRWLGSYANWRGLMFVYLYPENLLLPSLRVHRTGTFADIVAQLRNNPRLRPDMVCGVMKQYETYLADLHSLRLGASVTTTVYTAPDGCGSAPGTARNLTYLFARGGASMQVYWSSFDTSAGANTPQTLWEPVPELDRVHRIVGAFVYEIQNGERYLYVMGIRQPEGREQPVLIGNRYHLGTHRWQSDLEAFEAPVNPWTWIVSDRKDERASPVFAAVNYAYPAVYEYESVKVNVSALTGLTLRNRSLFFNRLNPEGVTWGTDEFGTVEINWIHDYRPVAMVQANTYVVVIAETNWNGTDHVMTHLTWNTDGSTNPRRFFRDGLNGADFSYLNGSTNPTYNAAYAAITFYSTNVSQPGDKIKKLEELMPSSSTPYRFVGLRLRSLAPNSSAQPFEFQMYYQDGTSTVTQWNLIYVTHSSASVSTQLPIGDYFNSAWVGPCMQHVHNASPIPTSMAIQPKGAGIPIQFQIDNAYSLVVAYLSPTPGVVYPLRNEGKPVANRRNAVQQLFQDNQYFTTSATYPSGNPNHVYLEEAYYHLPMLLALELQKQKFFVEALEMYRLVFDYSQAVGQRKVFYGLIREESLGNLMNNVFAWLDEPENPHTVAAQRAHSYTRFTVFSLVRCLLDYADQEYTRDTAESVPRARMLYETAARLLQDEFFGDADQDCAAALAGLDAQVDDAGWLPVWIKLRQRIAATNDHDLVHRMMDGFSGGGGYVGLAAAFADNLLSAEAKVTGAEQAFQLQLDARGSVSDRLCTILNQYSSSQWNLALLGGGSAATGRMAQLIRAGGNAQLNQALVAISGSEDLAAIDWLDGSATGTLPNARASAYTSESGHWTNQYAADPVGHLKQSGALSSGYVPYANHYFCVPRNPVPEMLRLHAELNLHKIRHCMNIAGIKRSIEPYAAATDSVSGMPVIGSGGQLLFPGAQSVPSTGFRFEFLLAKSKELSQYAQQLESALLSSLEKRDAEHYSLMKARQDVKVARASVRLQDLRIREAESGITLAEMQRNRSQVQIDGLQEMIDEGLTGWEEMQIDLMTNIGFLQATSAYYETAAWQASNSLLATGFSKDTFGISVGMGIAAAIAKGAGLAANLLQIREQTKLSIASIQASFERRKQDWEFSKVLANEDLKIGGQQVRLAQDRLQVVGQERHISQMQMDHAEATVDYLLNKFTNAELYDWMSRVLEGVYGYFLQQATAMAKLAQQQLAFERQVAPPSLVQDDYWYPSSENVSFEAGEGTRVDRKGLTGSTRLLQDITRLDLYAMETLRRKQQLTRQLSLAQLFPAEFAAFKQTGVMTFRTPMELFDRDFPGHYLRLIRKVRTTVVALVPPLEGVKARLSTTGIARVVTGPEVFQAIRQTRGAESVSLSGGYNDSGLFELNPLDGELLNPFEGMGVDATWEFRMDRRSNPFDFDTVADVILQLEYTALESEGYREEVLRQLGDTYNGEAGFSLKYSFPDQWYDLHNASLTATPYRVRLPLTRRAFPAHLRDVEVVHASLVCVLEDGVDPTQVRLGLYKDTPAGLSGGLASPNAQGVASTRQRPSQNGGPALYSGNAIGWNPLIGLEAAGDWYLDLVVDPLAPANGQAMLQTLFSDKKLRDIQLVITYEGE